MAEEITKVEEITLSQQSLTDLLTFLKKLNDTPLTEEMIRSEEFCNTYSLLEDLANSVTSVQKKVKDGILPILRENFIGSGETSIRTKDYLFTYKPSYQKNTFNMDLFKSAHPELAAELQSPSYYKISVAKDSITITPNKKKDE